MRRTNAFLGVTTLVASFVCVAATHAQVTFRDALRSGGQGPEMVEIPVGSFKMGCVLERQCSEKELPVREVVISQPFAVSKYEVTFEDYDRFTYPNEVNDQGLGRGPRPVINVSWNDAQEYVAWLSDQTGHNYRLLSEAEWEYAARAGSLTAHGWGNGIGRNTIRCDASESVPTCGDHWAQVAPVGSFAANRFGLHDMHGNAWEWVEDCWNGSFAGAPTNGRAWLRGHCDRRVARGGSWASGPKELRSTARYGIPRDHRTFIGGFRVAKTLAS